MTLYVTILFYVLYICVYFTGHSRRLVAIFSGQEDTKVGFSASKDNWLERDILSEFVYLKILEYLPYNVYIIAL